MGRRLPASLPPRQRRLRVSLRSWRVRPLMKAFPSLGELYTVIERGDDTRHLLARFVSLSCHQHDVTRRRGLDCELDGRASVANLDHFGTVDKGHAFGTCAYLLADVVWG